MLRLHFQLSSYIFHQLFLVLKPNPCLTQFLVVVCSMQSPFPTQSLLSDQSLKHSTVFFSQKEIAYSNVYCKYNYNQNHSRAPSLKLGTVIWQQRKTPNPKWQCVHWCIKAMEKLAAPKYCHNKRSGFAANSCNRKQNSCYEA